MASSGRAVRREDRPDGSQRGMRVGLEARPLFAEGKTGIGYYVTFLVQAMARADRELWLYWSPRQADGDAASLPDAPGLHHRPFDVPAGWLTFGLPMRLWLDRIRLCHFPLGVLPHYCPVPVVVTAYDLIWERMEHLFDTETVEAFRAGPGRSAPRADHVIAISECTRRDLMDLSGIPEERITVVHLAADPAMRPVEPQSAMAVARKHGLSRPFLLYVGGFFPHKNLPRLLSAYRAAFSGQPDAPALVLAGPAGPRATETEAKIADLGLERDVSYLGYVTREDLPALFSAAHAFVFPSLYEGFGLPPLEAMACGTPVACSNAASLPEVVGDAALAFDPHDEAAVVDALRRITEDDTLRAELRRKGVARAEHFSWERVADETWAVYEKMSRR